MTLASDESPGLTSCSAASMEIGDLVKITTGIYSEDGDFDKYIGPAILIDRHPAIMAHEDSYWAVIVNGTLAYCWEYGVEKLSVGA